MARERVTNIESPQSAAPEARNAAGAQRGVTAAQGKPRKRGAANLERAHKTVSPTTEAAPGAPRSGSV